MASEWIYGYASRKLVIEGALIRLWDAYGGKILAHTARGNIIWAVVSKPHYSVDLHAIVLIPMERGVDWKYRFYSERDHLKWVTCPESFLAQTHKSMQRNAVWRAKVREYHQKRRKQVRVGDRLYISLKGVPEVIVTRLNPLAGVYGGKEYRIPRRMIDLER
jgi:hypothetical protein